MRYQDAAPEAGAVRARPTIFDQVEEFGRKVLDFPYPKFPTRLNAERKAWFIQAMREELQEFEEAQTFEDEVDAISDMMVFAAGRFPEMGLKGQDHIDRVHGPNMKKVKGALSKRPGSQGYDAVKPEGWVAPTHADLLVRPKIIILGYARHGKDTVAEILRDKYGFAFQSSSRFLAERVMLSAFRERGIYYADADDCFDDRHGSSPLGDHRTFWYEQISAFNTPDKARLARELFEENDIYVGLRAEDEFKAAQKYAHIVVWVDASERGIPPEPRSSCTVHEEMADLTIENNGTLEDLERAVDEFVAQIERKPNV